MSNAQIVVIGGGIAGMSAAYALSLHPSEPSVRVIEAETGLTHHTTGRSAAILIENYGAAPVRALTKASLDYFRQPPSGLADRPLLEPRGLLTVAAPDDERVFEKILAEGAALNPTIGEVSIDEAVALFPALRPGPFSRAMHEPDAADIDVAALHQSYLRGVRRAGGTVSTSVRAIRLSRVDQRWRIETADGELDADIVVNAAGAWGDVVAASAGLKPVGLQPLRRTAFMVAGSDVVDPRGPLTAEVNHRWYVKPDGPQILCSPADETPSEPCDAKPEEIDIARAIDLINHATTLAIRSVASSWAGLRTFAPDRSMVIGPDPDEPSFIWCVGQGGTGIQTSPAAGQLVADLTLDGHPGPSFDRAKTGMTLALNELLPDRFHA